MRRTNRVRTWNIPATASPIQHWKAAVHTNPNHSQALYNLAKALNKIHDPMRSSTKIASMLTPPRATVSA